MKLKVFLILLNFKAKHIINSNIENNKKKKKIKEAFDDIDPENKVTFR